MGIYFLPAAPRELAPIAVPKLLVPIVLLVALMPYPMTLPLQPTYTCIGTQVWTAERIVSFPPALQPYYASLHGCGLGAILQLKCAHPTAYEARHVQRARNICLEKRYRCAGMISCSLMPALHIRSSQHAPL